MKKQMKKNSNSYTKNTTNKTCKKQNNTQLQKLQKQEQKNQRNQEEAPTKIRLDMQARTITNICVVVNIKQTCKTINKKFN
jgi:predicted metalloenzyme YecM